MQRVLDLQQRSEGGSGGGGGGGSVDWKTSESSVHASPLQSQSFSSSVAVSVRPPPEEWCISGAIASSILQAFFSQIVQWPQPIPGKTFLLPLCGDNLTYSVAESGHLLQGQARGQLSLHPVLAASNLMLLLGPHGLLQHLW